MSAIPTQLRRHEFRVRRYRFEAWIIDFYESAFENVIKVEFFCLKKRQGVSRRGLSRRSNKNVWQTTL